MLQDQHVSPSGPSFDALFGPVPAPVASTASDWQRWILLSAPDWQQVGEDGFVPDLPGDGRLLVPVRLWRGRKSELMETKRSVGLLIDEIGEPADLTLDLDLLSLVVVSFRGNEPGVPIARLLRSEFGYAGLLAALDVPGDRISDLHVDGFNALATRLPHNGRFKLEEQIALARLRR